MDLLITLGKNFNSKLSNIQHYAVYMCCMNSKLSNIQHYAVYMCCMPSRRLRRLDAPLVVYAYKLHSMLLGCN